jgi:hypothetical protein
MNSKHFGGIKLALLGLVGAGVVGYAGYRVFFNRPGEAATALIPSDASFVLTLDTNPSQSQLPTFLKITNALKAGGFDRDIEDGVGALVGKAGLAKSLRPFVTNNFAMAMWNSESGTKGLALFSLKDKSGAEAALKQGQVVPGSTVPAYRFDRPDMVFAIVGDYIALGSDVEIINRAEATRTNGQSVSAAPDFQSARAALPPDSNLMCFVSPQALAELSKNAPGQYMPMRWMSMSATVQNNGLQLDYRAPVVDKLQRDMGDWKSISPELCKKFPAGALAMVAYSQPSKFYSIFRSSSTDPKMNEAYEKSSKSFEEETGLSIEKEIVPALSGEFAIAAYPDFGGNTKSADIEIVLSNANGANPGDLVPKLRALFDREVSKHLADHPEKPAPKIAESNVAGATVWQFDSGTLDEMHKSMDETARSSFKDKNLIVATKDGNVYICSSNAMLMNALSPTRTLADDPVFTDLLSKSQDPQSYILVAVGRTLETYRAEIDQTMKGEFKTDDLLNLIGGPNAGLIGSGKVHQDIGTATLFIPLDWEKTIAFAAQQKNRSKTGSARTEPLEIR